jgi:hypothetical protein
MRPRQITRERAQEFADLVEEGRDYREAAEAIGFSVDGLLRRARQYGIIIDEIDTRPDWVRRAKLMRLD